MILFHKIPCAELCQLASQECRRITVGVGRESLKTSEAVELARGDDQNATAVWTAHRGQSVIDSVVEGSYDDSMDVRAAREQVGEGAEAIVLGTTLNGRFELLEEL